MDGGQRPDMDGSVGMYSRYSRIEVKDSRYVPTKAQVREGLNRLAADVSVGIDVAAAGVAVTALLGLPVTPVIGGAATIWGASRALHGCARRY